MNIPYTKEQISRHISERTSLPGFNWLAVLKDLADGSPLSGEDKCKLCTLAACWPTCACGQKCSVLPRRDDLAPIDLKLRAYGTAFYRRIAEQQWPEAIEIFLHIEERTKQLLGEHSELKTNEE